MTITSKIEIISELAKFYNENCSTNLKPIAKDIIKQFAFILKDYGEDFNLITQNSVHKIKYYNINYRVKKDISLFEKLIRKSFGLTIINKFDLKEIQDVHRKSVYRPPLSRHDF